MATFRTLHIFPRHGRDVYGNEDTGEVQINADAVRLLRVNEDGRVEVCFTSQHYVEVSEDLATVRARLAARDLG